MTGEAALRNASDIKRHFYQQLCDRNRKPTGKAAQNPSVERAQAIHLLILQLEAALITKTTKTMLSAKKMTKMLVKAELLGASLLPLQLDWRTRHLLLQYLLLKIFHRPRRRQNEGVKLYNHNICYNTVIIIIQHSYIHTYNTTCLLLCIIMTLLLYKSYSTMSYTLDSM